MLTANRTKIHPTPAQRQPVGPTFGGCRYHLDAVTHPARSHPGLSFLSVDAFDRWIRQKGAHAYPWTQCVSSKAQKTAIINAQAAYRRFFKGLLEPPKFKKKHQQSARV